MDITIPAVPLGILTLLAFLGPYAVSALNAVLPFVREPWQRRALSIVVALLLAAVVLVLYIAITGDAPTGWPAWFLFSVVVLAASYALVTKPSAAKVEQAIEARP